MGNRFREINQVWLKNKSDLVGRKRAWLEMINFLVTVSVCIHGTGVNSFVFLYVLSNVEFYYT